MVIIRQFIKPDSVELQIQGNYLKDNGSSFHEMLAYGFIWNKKRRLYLKTYRNKEYIDDCFHRDIDLIKRLWEYYQVESYRQVGFETNVKGK